jgi:hypothetical protein
MACRTCGPGNTAWEPNLEPKAPVIYPTGPIGSASILGASQAQSLRMGPADAQRALVDPQETPSKPVTPLDIYVGEKIAAIRQAQRKPKLLIIGHGRHGKDTVAEMLRDRHGFTFASSSYFAADRVVRPAMAACGKTYADVDECYADRANHRAFWYEAISLYNSGGRSRLAEAILVDHDIYVGMRSNAEYLASRGMFDLVVWVDATKRGLPPEPAKSMDIVYDPKTMNLIDNGGSLEDLENAVDAFVRALNWSCSRA